MLTSQFARDASIWVGPTGAINKWSFWRVPVTGGEPAQIVEDCNGPGALSPDGKLVGYEFRSGAIT